MSLLHIYNENKGYESIHKYAVENRNVGKVKNKWEKSCFFFHTSNDNKISILKKKYC